MSTLVFVHAHPDDEASQTAGAMCRAVEEGHRVVLVVSTGGEHGEAAADLAPGETVAQRRRVELAGSASLGTVHLPFPGVGTVEDFAFDVDGRLSLRPR